jgi:hypothetical protein
MGRRYLTPVEAGAALNRGKSIECFIGPCQRDGRRGFQHCSMRLCEGGVKLSVFETSDLGLDESDVTEWGPLNSTLELGDADETSTFRSLTECLASMEERWPGSSSKLVNEGMLQDEYVTKLHPAIVGREQ